MEWTTGVVNGCAIFGGRLCEPRGRPVPRSLLMFLATLCLFAATTAIAQQPAWPGTVRLIVPFAAGGGTDAFARAIAAQLGPRLGVNVIVENRAGAGSLIGSAAVAKGPADGSQLLFTSSSLVTATATSRNAQFDVQKDLVPVAFAVEAPLLVALSAKSGIRSPADLVAAARARPDELTYASAGVGSLTQLAEELLLDAARIKMRHIPYKGSAPALIDVAAGTVDMTIGSYSALVSQFQSGRVIPIAVTTLAASPAFPNLPTMASSAPGYNVGIWYGLFAPAGLPAPMIRRLHREIVDIAKSAELKPMMKDEGGAAVEAEPEELARRVRDEYAMWKKLAAEKQLVTD